MPGSLVAHAVDLGPTGGDVGDGQRGGEVAVVVPALVTDQFDLDEPPPGLVPVGPSNVAQHIRNASITSGPYLRIGVRGARCGRGPAAAIRNALRA